MNKQRQMIVRILIAVAVGMAVSVIAILTAWRNDRAMPGLNFGQFMSRTFLLPRIDKAIRAYQQTHNSLPASLADLKGLKDSHVTFDENGDVLDPWGRPFVYTRAGTQYDVRSLGRDGKPGGAGLDCDLSISMADPHAALPTLWQFLFELPTIGIVGSCLFGGFLAAVQAFLMVKTPRFSVAVLTKILLTIIGAVIVSSIIAVLHIPTGH